MFEFTDAVDFYLSLIGNLKKGSITFDAPLDIMVLRVAWEQLAYVDNRRDAKKNGYDFWKGIDIHSLTGKIIGKGQLYSESQVFPDFVFKVKEHEGHLLCGSLLETKDSSGGSISSFNSTIPTGMKSMEEVDTINNGGIVSKIACIKDGKLASNPDYHAYQRRCFYLIRTHKGSDKVRTSLVDGSFFETVPKNYLISQMFINILEKHHSQKKLNISEKKLIEIKELLSSITDQTIIASSQSIDKASVKPRLRIMAEVNPEGNPHSSHYPQIEVNTINFILPKKILVEEVYKRLTDSLPELKLFSLQHKRNGEYAVFEYKS